MTSEPAVRDVLIGGQRIALAPHNCFACGTLNVHGLQLELHAADGLCWVELELAERFQGWEGIAHGGIVCTLLDEVMAWAVVDHDMWGVTARMSVEFKKPVPLGRPIPDAASPLHYAPPRYEEDDNEDNEDDEDNHEDHFYGDIHGCRECNEAHLDDNASTCCGCCDDCEVVHTARRDYHGNGYVREVGNLYYCRSCDHTCYEDED